MSEINTRYPGTQSFESSQRNIFFGRDKDIEKLTQMVELERMVLVYAKSGIGKTSLINAGVLPALQDKGKYTFQKIRFGAWQEGKPTPNNAAISSFASLQDGQNYIDKIIYKDHSLWYFAKLWQIKQLELKEAGNETLLLIFDQFEELFSYPEDQITQFKQDLAELLFTVVPQRFTNQKELLSEIKPGFLSGEEERLLFTQPNVKILFAIRNDRMSQLNKMSDYIPRILLKHYELSPLTNEQAKDAICRPAQLDGIFSSQKFCFNKEALDEIMYFLTKDGTQNDNIESFQLQILCKVVEDKVKSTLLKEILSAHITPVKDIYQNYYDNLIEGLPIDSRKKYLVRVMIEDGLIEEATRRRLQLSGEQIDLKYHIEKETLGRLIEERLLRIEEHDKFRLYELSHDTLVEPIIESSKVRKEKEEEERAQAEHLEQLRIANEKAEKERLEREKERKRKIQFTVVFSAAALVSIAFGIFGFINMNKANDNIRRLIIKDAYSYTQEERFLSAKGKYEQLLRYTDTTEAIHKRIKECIFLDSLSRIFNKNDSIIDSLVKLTNIEPLKKAKELISLNENLNYPYGKKKLAQRQNTYKLQISSIINEQIRLAEMQINAGLRDDAANTIRNVEILDPENAEILEFKKQNNFK